MLLKNKKGETFEMPAWQDCGWRRLSCEEPSCPICGRVQRQRQQCLARGLDPDSPEALMEGVGETFAEVKELLQKDAERMGIDLNNLEQVKEPEPPPPESYALYQKIMAWRKDVFAMLEAASQWGEQWLQSEESQDLSWYANLLPVKVYRALSDKWEMENSDPEVWVDYHYTKYVIEESIKILHQAFAVLRAQPSLQCLQLQFLPSALGQMEEEIKKI